MTIKYYLRDPPITNEPNDKSAWVDQRGTLDENAVLDEMLKRGTGLTKQEILGVIDLYTEVVSDQVQSGFVANNRFRSRPRNHRILRSRHL